MEQDKNNTSNVDVHNVQESQQSKEPAEVKAAARSGMGPVIGIVIIVLLLIFGGLYFWGTELNQQTQVDEAALLDGTSNNDIAPDSDEPVRIESDLDAFDTTDFEAQLDADLEALEAKL